MNCIQTTSYTYDALNRLTGLADPQANRFSFSYDALGRRTGLGRSNGVNTAYSYDALSRLLSVLHQNGNRAIDGASYAYAAAGNRTSKTNFLKKDSTTTAGGGWPMFRRSRNVGVFRRKCKKNSPPLLRRVAHICCFVQMWGGSSQHHRRIPGIFFRMPLGLKRHPRIQAVALCHLHLLSPGASPE